MQIHFKQLCQVNEKVIAQINVPCTNGLQLLYLYFIAVSNIPENFSKCAFTVNLSSFDFRRQY